MRPSTRITPHSHSRSTTSTPASISKSSTCRRRTQHSPPGEHVVKENFGRNHASIPGAARRAVFATLDIFSSTCHLRAQRPQTRTTQTEGKQCRNGGYGGRRLWRGENICPRRPVTHDSPTISPTQPTLCPHAAAFRPVDGADSGPPAAYETVVCASPRGCAAIPPALVDAGSTGPPWPSPKAMRPAHREPWAPENPELERHRWGPQHTFGVVEEGGRGHRAVPARTWRTGCVASPRLECRRATYPEQKRKEVCGATLLVPNNRRLHLDSVSVNSPIPLCKNEGSTRRSGLGTVLPGLAECVLVKSRT
ncbi:hypothetical protein OF83DRAFT_555889 [Amylostereum chailletii]|nr:hypothetical protein OF83DRAFT_555889 [Amylostereum chailletii]